MDMSALGGSGITVQIKGRELDTLQEIARDVAAIVESVEGTVDVSDGLEESTGELRIIIDRNKAIEHGLTVAQIFQQNSFAALFPHRRTQNRYYNHLQQMRSHRYNGSVPHD